MDRKILKKIQIKYSVRESPCIDIPLTEFMGAVFREFHKIVNIRGDSADIIRISDDPMVYHIILYESNNSMHKIRFENFLGKINKFAENSKCLPDKLSITDITLINYGSENHPELREGEVWITNGDWMTFAQCSFLTKRYGKLAYSIRGQLVKGLVPIFAQKFEVEKLKEESS